MRRSAATGSSQRRLDLRRATRRPQPHRDRSARRAPAAPSGDEPRQRLALRAQLEERPRRLRRGRARRARRRAPRSGARPSPRAAPSTSSTPIRAPSPCSSASFSSSRSSRCWRSPTCATSACAAAPLERRGRAARASLDAPTCGSSRGFSAVSATTSPPAFFTAAASFAGTFARPSSRAKNATVVSGAIARERRDERALDVRVLPALDAVDDEEPPPDRERHRAQRERDRLGRRRRRPRTPRRRRCRDSASAIARRRARRSAMRPWSSPWMR